MSARFKNEKGAAGPRARKAAYSLCFAAVAATCWAGCAFAVDAPGSSPPIKIAVFDFELEDFSAAGGTGASPDVAKYLAHATDIAKRQLAESGRYSIIDTAGADLSAAKGQGLRNCRGCDAAIAAKLGADQDMVGVVTKISMTEYTVTVQVTDARNGAAVATFTTGLRIGAAYSWDRGVTWLMKNRVLASREKP